MGCGMSTVESPFLLLQIRVERPKARGEVAAGKEGLVAPGGPGQ